MKQSASEERLAEILAAAEQLHAEEWGFVEDDERVDILIVRAPNDAVVAKSDDYRRASFIADCDPDTIRSIITELLELRKAASPAPADSGASPSMGRVTAIDWAKNGHNSLWSGELVFRVYYTICDEGDGWRVFRSQLLSEAGEEEVAFHRDLGVAKAAAQADYEARILSALNLPPDHGGGEGETRASIVEECAKAAVLAIRDAAVMVPKGPFMDEQLPSRPVLCQIVRDAVRSRSSIPQEGKDGR